MLSIIKHKRISNSHDNSLFLLYLNTQLLSYLKEKISYRSIPITASIVILVFLQSCKTEYGPREDDFPIYVNTLRTGFDMGVESSEKLRDWLYEIDGSMKMAYPAGQEDGSVFIVVGAVALENVTEDFSDYNFLVLDLKGENGGEYVVIDIEDGTQSPSTPQFVSDLDKEWKTYVFPFLRFGVDINLKELRTVTKFSFYGNMPQTVHFRNVSYLKDIETTVTELPFYIFSKQYIASGYRLGVAIDSTAMSPDSMEIYIKDDFLEINYPSSKQWGSVFFYREDDIPQDLSCYDSISFELKGHDGSEIVHVGVRDTSNFPNDVRIEINDTIWHSYVIPCYVFTFINWEQVVVAASFTFYGEKAQSIYVRNIYYKKQY